MTMIRINDMVRVEETIEPEPLNFIKKGTIAVVIDETEPNYARIKFGYRIAWVDKRYLKVIND